MARPSRKRQDILRAARSVFVEAGAEARMDAIARRAGVSKGAVYHHFPGKAELLKALCEQEHSRMGELLESIASAPSAPPEKLRALVEGAQAWFGSLEHPPRFFLVMADAAARDPELQALWLGIHERLVQRLAGVIDEGVRDGSFVDVDALAVGSALKALSDGTAMATAIGAEPRAAQAQQMVALLLRGMLAS
jgi:AcrR family transcriptional regulator